MGPANATERPLDLYIDGDGLFQVQIEDDVGEGLGYTRAGNFAVNADGEIVMANDQGRRLTPPITIPEEATGIDILADGTVMIGMPGSIDAQEVGRIELALFVNPAGLKQIGENIYIPSPASGEAQLGEPREGGRGAIRQGFLEASNVDPVTELVNLIKTQRAFELNSQSIQAADEVLQTASQLRRL